MLSSAINTFPKTYSFSKVLKKTQTKSLDYINTGYSYENARSQQVNRKIWTKINPSAMLKF